MRRFLIVVTLYLLPVMLPAQPQAVVVTPLYNYDFTGNESELKPGVNCFVLTTRKQFEKFFGTVNRADTPQFSKENVLLLIMPASKKDAMLSFRNANTKAGSFVEVYCHFELNKGKLTYKAFPTALGRIAKYKGVKTVNFYDDNDRLVKTVEIK